MEDWVQVWKDKATPPYELIRVVLPVHTSHLLDGEGNTLFRIYYRTFQRAVENSVWAKDELDAYIKSVKLMDKFKAKSEYAKRRKSNA